MMFCFRGIDIGVLGMVVFIEDIFRDMSRVFILWFIVYFKVLYNF